MLTARRPRAVVPTSAPWASCRGTAPGAARPCVAPRSPSHGERGPDQVRQAGAGQPRAPADARHQGRVLALAADVCAAGWAPLAAAARPCTPSLRPQHGWRCGGTAVRGAWPRTHAAATRATELGCAAQGSPRHRRCPVLHCARAWRSPPTHARSRVRDALGGFAARLQIRTKPLQPAAASACARTAPGAEQASRRLIRAAPALMPVLQFTRKAFVCKMSALRLALWTRRARLVLRGEAATAAPNPGSLAPYL